MATGSSDQHHSYVRNQNDGSFGEGSDQSSSQQNQPCGSDERIPGPHHTDPALPKHPDIFAPGQHAELRISRAPLSQMDSYPYSLENFRDPNDAFREAEATQQEMSPGRGAGHVIHSTSIQKQLTRYGCYSIPSSRTIMAYPAGQCLPTLYEDILHVQNNAYSHCLYPKAEPPSEKNNAFPSCLYPKQLKTKLNVSPPEKPPEPMESGEVVKHRNRSVRVSLMASAASPEQISFKLLHEEPALEPEPEPENIAMPLEIMPLPPPPDEVVEVKLLPVEDSYKAHAKQYFRSCLGVSCVVMRALGIGTYVGLALAHQFAVYSVKVLKNGLHVYGPVVAKATVSSYKGLRKGGKVFLQKSAPIANHAKKVTLAHIRRTQEGCVQEMMKQCLACFPFDIDAEYEMESLDETRQPGSNRPSHHDNEHAWKESLRLYPEHQEDSEAKSESEVSCSQEECMAGNLQDKPTTELSVLEDCSSYGQEKDFISEHDKKRPSRSSKRNSDKISSTVPFKGVGSGYSPDYLSRVRKRLLLSSVRNNQRENFGIQGLGALVWPPPDIRRFSDPIRGHQFIPNLAVRPGTKNYRDLIQEPPLEDEFIWRRTLRAYFPEKGADVRPEDVLLCRQAAPMKLLSMEEFERNKEDPMMPDRDGRLGLGTNPSYSDHLKAGELFYPSYSKKQPDYQHIKQPPLLQISHGDNIVHHCVPNRKFRTHELPNRGKDNKELGHLSLAHLKYDDFGRVGKSHFDDSEKLMRNEASSGISSIHFRMEEDFWQANPIHSSESNWKSFRGSEAPHPHGKKRPHSPGSDSMEELPHSREAAGKSINSSRAHPHGKHQKLEVMSAPDSLMQAKFSKRPLRISKPKLSSDRSKFDSPAESRQSGRSLKTKPLDSRQSTPLKGRPPFHIPKISQTPRKVLVDRYVRSVHIPFSDKHSHSTPSSPVKRLDLPIPADFGLRSSDLFPSGRKPLLSNWRYYLRIHPQPPEKPYSSARRTPIVNGDGGVSRTSSMRQASADDLKRKGRYFYKRPRSRAPFKSCAPDVHSEGKSKPSVFKIGLSFLRDSLSSKTRPQKSAREDDKPHPSAQSSFWNLPLDGKFQLFNLKKSRPAPRPHSPRMPHGKIHDHSNVGQISHIKKRDQGLTPFPSQGSQKEPKRRPLYENIPRLKIFLSKKDPHGIRSLSQVKCRQHGTVLRINSSKKNPSSSAGGDKRTKTNSKVPKILKKDVPQASPRSCISFLYPIAPAKRKSVERNVRGRLSSPKKTADSGITPSSPGKMSKGPNTHGAKARSLSPSPSKRRRKVHFQKPTKLQPRCDNYAPIRSELTSIDGTNTSHIYEDQISDMDIERSSKPKPEDAASEKSYVENPSPAAVTLSTVRDTVESVNVDNADVKPASTTADTSESAVLQPSEMMMDRGNEDGDDASSDTPYRLNPEISSLLKSYKQALIREARKEPKPPSTGCLESERQQDSKTELHSKADAAQLPYQQSSNFDEPTFLPLSELFQDVNLQTLESTSKETLDFDVDSETSLLGSFKEGIESIEPHDKNTSHVDHTVEGDDDSVALENFDEQKRCVDHPEEGEGALENHHLTLPAHLDKPEHRDEIQFYSSGEIIVSPTDHTFAESDKQNRGVDHPGEGGGEDDGALDIHNGTLPAHLEKQEPWDETHVYSPDGMNLSPTNDSIANNGQQDRGVDPPLKDEGALEDHHRTLPAQIDKVEQRDEAYFYSPDEMNLPSTDHSFAESSHQNRDADHPGEGQSTLENHHRTLPFHFDKEEHGDVTHFTSPDGMNFSPTDQSFSESSQQNRGVDHAGEGAGTLDIHRPKLPAPLDEHELEHETHFSSPVGMNSSPIDHSFADSGQLTKDGELFQTLDQLEPVYRQKDLGHLNEGYNQGEKSPASLAVDEALAESQVDERLPSEDHHIVLEYTTIIRGVKESPLERQADDGHDQGEKSSAALPIDQPFALPSETLELLDQTTPSKDGSGSRLFNVEIDTPEEIILNSNEYVEPGHGTKDEGQMSMISAEVDNQGKDKIEQVEEDVHLEYPTSRPPDLDQDDSQNSSSIKMKIIERIISLGDKPKNENRKAWEVVSSAEEELEDSARRSLPPVKLDVEDDDNSKHKTPSELGNPSRSLVISEIQDLHYPSNHVKEDEHLHPQDLQIDPQEEPEYVSSLPPRLLHDAMQIEKDQKYEMPVKPEHHNKLVVERDEADNPGIKELGEFSQGIESTYHQRPRVADGEGDRQSSVSSESQRSNTEQDTTPTSAMIDENFPKLKFSEKLVAWEMLARAYQPPAEYNGPSDDLATFVTVPSQHDQPSPESPQVRGLDLAKPSIEKASKQGHFDNENSVARPKDTLELSREYAAEEVSPLTTDDQSSRDVHNLALNSPTTIRGEQESPLEHQTDESHDNSSETPSASLPIDQPLIRPTEILQQSNQTAPPSIEISRSQPFDVAIDVVEETIFDNDEYVEKVHETDDEGQMSKGSEHEDNEEKEKIEQVEGSSHLGSPSSRSTYSNQNDSENYSSTSEKLFKEMIIDGDRPRKEKRKAWEVVSSAEQELDDNARSLPLLDVEDDDNDGFESASNSDALEGKAENTLLESEVLVSPQLSLSESYETASEQGFATNSDSEEEVHRSRSFESLQLESGTSPPSDGNNFSPPARSKRSIFKRPVLKKSLNRASGNEQTFAALQQLQTKPESPATNLNSSPGSSSQGSSDGTSTPPARSKGSVFIRPVLKMSLVENKETEQMFAQLRSEKNSQIDQPSSTGPEDNASSKQIENFRETEVRRSSSFDGLGGSSEGRGSGSAPQRRSLFTRPVLKKTLESSNETEEAFSRLRSEQSDNELRFDVKDGARESGYQSDSLLDDNRSDENLIPPAGSRKRKSLFTRPFLKPSLVATSETEELFSRLQVKQNFDTGNEEGFDTGPEGGISRSASFEGTISDSSNKSQGLDRISIPARPRNSSLFTRPMLKPSLVATLETEELFSRLQVEQDKDTGNEERFDIGPEGGMRRSESFEGITKLDSSNSSQGLNRILIPARPRNSSLFTRPILKPSLVSNTETERIFAQLQSQQNENEEHQSRREQRLGTREGEGGDIRRSSGFEGPTGLKDPIILDEMAVPRRGPRGSLLRSSIISTSENQEEDEAELSVNSAFTAGLESGASSQSLEGTSNFPPERSEESEGKTSRWEVLSRGPDRLDQPRRSALKRSSVGTLDAEQSINEQTIRKSVNFDPSFLKDTSSDSEVRSSEDTSSDSEARSSASDASESLET